MNITEEMLLVTPRIIDAPSITINSAYTKLTEDQQIQTVSTCIEETIDAYNTIPTSLKEPIENYSIDPKVFRKINQMANLLSSNEQQYVYLNAIMFTDNEEEDTETSDEIGNPILEEETEYEDSESTYEDDNNSDGE